MSKVLKNTLSGCLQSLIVNVNDMFYSNECHGQNVCLMCLLNNGKSVRQPACFQRHKDYIACVAANSNRCQSSYWLCDMCTGLNILVYKSGSLVPCTITITRWHLCKVPQDVLWHSHGWQNSFCQNKRSPHEFYCIMCCCYAIGVKNPAYHV